MDSGFVTLTAQHISDRQVTVTPSAAPLAGKAEMNRSPAFLGFGFVSEALSAEPSGNDLVIKLSSKCQIGDNVFWFSFN